MKKIKFISAATIIGFALTLSSCRQDRFGCIRGEGVAVTELRSLSNFTSIDVDADAEVYIFEDSVFSFSVKAQQNIVDNLESRVSSGKLIVRERRCVRNKSNIVIHIHAPIVADIELRGSGNITVYKSGNTKVSSSTYTIKGSGKIEVNGIVNADNLFVKITGSGDLEIPVDVLWASLNITGSGKVIAYGECGTSENYITGSGKIDAFGLETRDAYANISGSGRVNVYATDNLDIDISGSGDVYYKGWPKINTRISGSGKVVHEN